MSCVVQAEEEGVSILAKVGFDERAVVATFSEQDAGPFLDGVRQPFIELLFDSHSTKGFTVA